MAEVLSQDEIDRLLNVINAASVPDIFSGEQIQAVSYIHENICIPCSTDKKLPEEKSEHIQRNVRKNISGRLIISIVLTRLYY